MTEHRFSQIDVFADRLTEGNPVAVVHDADDLTDETMAAFAAWTNLSETTFLLEPTDPTADYRLRIFTPDRELSFAGHPTLGAARAWLDAAEAPRDRDTLVQECAAGLLRIRREIGSGGWPEPRLARERVHHSGLHGHRYRRLEVTERRDRAGRLLSGQLCQRVELVRRSAAE